MFILSLKAKMQISWVLSEKERDRRYNKLKKVGFRNDFRRSTSESSTTTLSTEPTSPTSDRTLAIPPIPEVHFTVEEMLHLENLRNFMRNISKIRYETFFSVEPSCLNHLASVSYFGGPLKYHFWKMFQDVSDIISREMYLNLPCMKEIHPNDQVKDSMTFHW